MSWRSHSKRLGIKTKKGAASSTSMPIGRKKPTHAEKNGLPRRCRRALACSTISLKCGFAPSTQDKGTKVDPTWVEALANRATDCWQRRARPRPQSRTAHVRIDLYQQPKANVLKTAIRLNRQKAGANASAMIHHAAAKAHHGASGIQTKSAAPRG